MGLTKKDVRELAMALSDELSDRQPSLDSERHADHHRWVELQIEACERRKAWRDKLSNSVVGGIILLAVSGLAWVGITTIRLLRSE